MGLNWRIAYISFALSLIVTLVSIIHSIINSREFEHPNSREGIAIHHVQQVLSGFLMILSIVGFTVLLIEFGNKLVAMLYTTWLFTCILLASFVVIRTIAWVNFTHQEKLEDSRNESINYIVRHGRLPEHLLFVQDHHKCCGVQNILEWPTILKIKRRVPDSCCVPTFRKRRCGEKALPYTKSNEKFCGKRCEKEFQNTTAKVDLTRRSGVKAPFNVLIFDNTTTEAQRSFWRKKIEDSKIELSCKADTFNKKLIYFFTEAENENGGISVQTSSSNTSQPTDLYKPVETLCYELYEKDKGTFENFLLSRVEQTGHFYTQGCMEHLVMYTEKIVVTASAYSIVMGILAFIDIIVFYHYYWEFRLPQLAKLPLPVWFERLGSGDIAPFGLGRKTVSMTEDKELILRDLRLAGILIDAESAKARSQGYVMPQKSRYKPVRVYHPPNKEYPKIRLDSIGTGNRKPTDDSPSKKENTEKSRKPWKIKKCCIKKLKVHPEAHKKHRKPTDGK